jgi:hypothetical protein
MQACRRLIRCTNTTTGKVQLAIGSHLEDVLVEVLLQALVGQVDAQLLERVGHKALEAVDVQDADHALVLSIPSCAAAHGSMSALDTLPAPERHTVKVQRTEM